MRKKALWRAGRLMLAALLCMVPLSGCYLLPPAQVTQQTYALEPVEISYATYEVTRGDIEDKVTAPGSLVSKAMTDVHFVGYGGNLKQIHVKLGQPVKAGDVLVELDTRELERLKTLQFYQRKQATIRKNSIRGGEDYELEIAEYSERIAQIRYETTVERIENATLVAPVDGIIAYIAPYRKGNYINAYTDIIRIADPTQLRVVIDGKAAAQPFVAGAEVSVTYKGKTYRGTVSQGIHDGVIFRNQDHRLQAFVELEDFPATAEDLGKPVLVTYRRQYKRDVIVIPVGLITEYNGHSFVRLLVDGTKQEVEVETGIVTATQAEIVSGLKEGDLIIRN